jgi:transcriptional regulator with XRE-family HTH domain
MGFAENLRNELDYQGLIVRQLAVKTGVNINTINHYLSGNKSMPPADVAVKIASVLGVTVEYLITGKVGTHKKNEPDISAYLQYRPLLDNLRLLRRDVRDPIITMIENMAERERKKHKS